MRETLDNRTRTRAESIRQLLADDIVRGRLPPGLPLDESEIARKFGVSRTPVREAIRQLEATGLAEARPRRGAVVAAVTRERLSEMFFMMLELEALCAREAATNMTAVEREALARLQESGARVADSADPVAYGLHNLAFHDAIYAGAHNVFLTELTLGVRNRLAPFRQAQFDGPGRLVGSQREHGLVVAAILEGDGERAGEMMRGHIRAVRDAYTSMMPLYGLADTTR
ncbi:MAG: GntR family transcriptional regulator [Hyphomicrobiaceae bacterium]